MKFFLKKSMFALFLIMVLLFTGCKGKGTALTLKDVQTNTLFIKADGTVQAANVEEFDKEYYDKDELKNFIDESIKEYTEKAGTDAVVLDSFEVTNKKAKAIMKFGNIEDYKEYNHTDIQLFNGEDASKVVLPEQFVNAEDNSTVGREIILSNQESKLIIVKDALDIKIDGTIKYYSNAVLIDNHTVSTNGEEESVIVFE